MSRLRRILLLPALAVSAALLIATPASALPAFVDSESGWARFLEPWVRLGHLFSLDGWSTDPTGRVAPPPSNQGWDTDPNG